jgi:hypothetical protein
MIPAARRGFLFVKFSIHKSIALYLYNSILENMKMDKNFRYHHLGIPTSKPMEGEVYLAKYKFYHSGYEESEYGIEWMRFENDCPLPEIVKTLPHVAFEVDDIHEAINGKKIIIEPNSPSDEVIVAFIEENGAPVELIQLRKK